ncbi:MAG: copper resistance protein NlpE N-terminal domain-containing protein [Bacteroidota bacterium]
MTRKISFLALAGLLFLGSCQENQSEKKDAKTTEKESFKEEHNAKNSLDYTGVYYADVPCEDCEIIKYKLAITEDDKFHEKYVYVGEDKVVSNEGKIEWMPEGNKVILHSRNGEQKGVVIQENKVLVSKLKRSVIKKNQNGFTAKKQQ